MKKIYLFLFIIITLTFEIVFSIKCIDNDNIYKNDTVKINELVRYVEENYDNLDKYAEEIEYTVLDNNENIIYKTDNAHSQSLNEAYKNRDTIIDFKYNNKEGKIIVYNDFYELIDNHKSIYIKVIVIVSIIQLLVFITYYMFLEKNILVPFKKMKNFATRITSGNLDIPLKMDKNNNFGAFTEAFDIMRSEIVKSRKAEKEANEAKKELVAKLSHDIKTPISSIKSYSELGSAITQEEKSREYFESINHKSDQMSMMITNLFNSTLEELEELELNPTELKSNSVEKLINESDYLNKNKSFNIPKCTIWADKLRLQQVFDNIFANSYKYANTEIETEACIEDEKLVISIKDFGNSISDEEVPLLTEKFKRGNNIDNIDGTGLGLYISKEFLNKMNGDLKIENCNPGFKVIIELRIIN